MALKKKKMYEKQQEQIENNMQRIEEQKIQLENQASMATTVSAMKLGARANKATMQVWAQSRATVYQDLHKGRSPGRPD